MKALVLEEYMRLVYKDVPEPEYGDDDVLIDVKAAGICGSDVHGMDGSTGRRQPPVIMGHEASGVIRDVGKNVSDWQSGDRVTFDSTIYPLDDWYTLRGKYNLSDNRKVLGVSCGEYNRPGAFAGQVVVPRHILYKIPDDVTFTQAAMVEPVAVATHATDISPLHTAANAVVVGAGMVGLFVVQVLKIRGCSKIIAVDLEGSKLKLAKKLGATHTFNAGTDEVAREVHALTDHRGADIAFEVVGIAPTINCAIDTVRKGGAVTCIGNLSPSVDFPLQSVVTRQIRIQGSCAICGEYPVVLDMMSRGLISVEGILSAEAPLSEGVEWFKRLYDKEPGLIKVVLKP